jgi:hypothetical protein
VRAGPVRAVKPMWDVLCVSDAERLPRLSEAEQEALLGATEGETCSTSYGVSEEPCTAMPPIKPMRNSVRTLTP